MCSSVVMTNTKKTRLREQGHGVVLKRGTHIVQQALGDEQNG